MRQRYHNNESTHIKVITQSMIEISTEEGRKRKAERDADNNKKKH